MCAGENGTFTYLMTFRSCQNLALDVHYWIGCFYLYVASYPGSGSSAKICAPWLASQEPKGGVQQDWRRKELCVLDDCVLWGARVVVPPPGRDRLIRELREIHPGIARMKSLARSCVWWPSMDADLEGKLQTCTKCQSSRPHAEWLCWREGEMWYIWPLINWISISVLYVFCYCI